MSQDLQKEVASRKTFAIISHPDAGKRLLQSNYYCLVALFVQLGR